jgi:hypothetical protein
VHRDVPGQIVKDIRLRQVVERIGMPQRNGGGKLPVSEAVEKQESWDITANRFRLKTGQRREKSIDVR